MKLHGRLRQLALAGVVAAGAGLSAADGAGPVRWEGWSQAAFERARREERFVLLDLEAVWCHWCHVMDRTTYRAPEVVELIEARFVPVRVDQDARPDLANRYEDYGWPATVIFDAAGRELVKFQGYIPPERMRSLLRGVIADPTPGPSALAKPPLDLTASDGLGDERRSELAKLFDERYDDQHGGWGFSHKFLDADSVEWAIERAARGDSRAERMARETLSLQRRHLIDPVWGGVYQYSDGGMWTNPHFEKIVSVQADNLRSFARAYAQWRDPADLAAALDVHRYLQGFLKAPEGGFYVSQDADLVRGEHAGEYFALPDAERRRRGVPRVDTHLYTRETAWVASALVCLYAAGGDQAHLAEAKRAADWIVRNRVLAGGGFRHDAADTAGPYLGDTLAAGRAFLSLYSASGERSWLSRAREAADFILARFVRDGRAGLATAAASGSSARAAQRSLRRLAADPLRREALDDVSRGAQRAASGPDDDPLPQREENVQAARFANLLFHYTGEARFRALADQALGYLAIRAVAERFNVGGVLLADLERRSDPLHVTVVGGRQDPAAQELLRAALALRGSYKRVELWDPAEGPLPRADVRYPRLARPAAFLCSDGRCSAPAYSAADLRRRLVRVTDGEG